MRTADLAAHIPLFVSYMSYALGRFRISEIMMERRSDGRDFVLVGRVDFVMGVAG